MLSVALQLAPEPRRQAVDRVAGIHTLHLSPHRTTIDVKIRLRDDCPLDRGVTMSGQPGASKCSTGRWLKRPSSPILRRAQSAAMGSLPSVVTPTSTLDAGSAF